MHWLSKLYILIVILCCASTAAVAQQTITIKGVIFRKSSTGRVAQAVVSDLNNKNVMMSDDLGMFSIRTAIGDTLVITKKDYTPIQMVVVDANDLSLYLQPVVELHQVTVKGQTTKQELNDVMRQYKSQGIFNDGKSLPFWTFVNSPITGLYNLFGKTPAEARRFAAFSKAELETNEVNRRYTKELVKSVTKLPDDEVPKFMEFYRPSFQDIQQWNDYQLITAIKKNFNYYQRTKSHTLQTLPKVEVSQP